MRLSMVFAVTVLAVVLGACGSGGAQDDAASSAITASNESEVDYGELRNYDCEYLEGLLDEVVGPGDHGGEPDESWSVESDFQSGCGFVDLVMTVRINLASPDEHTLEWSLGAPDDAVEREELAVDVGDEGYLEDDGRTLILMVRKGLIEMRLTADSHASNPVTPEELVAFARVILEPWPFGEGAQES